MIPRYARPEMTAIWSDETKYRIHFEIEAHAADALAELGVIPKAAAAQRRQVVTEVGGLRVAGEMKSYIDLLFLAIIVLLCITKIVTN